MGLMKVFYSVDEAADNMAHGALAVGNFDGVHLGHQALIRETLKLKGQFNSGVLTFSPHPQEILQKKAQIYLTTDEDKIRIFSRLGIDVVVIEPINQEFLSLSPKCFVENILVKKLGAKQVIVGHDFTFGEKAEGNVEMLRSLGSLFGFGVFVVPPVMVNNERCSSSRVRELLALGQVTLANAMLGRHYSLRGTVITGRKLGGPLGFSTANLKPNPCFGVRRGVYATITRVYEQQNSKEYLSATNVGVRPTISHDDELIVESHCLTGNPDLYGKSIEVFFVQYLRDEEEFDSITALQEQVQKDCLMIRQMFHGHPQLFQVVS